MLKILKVNKNKQTGDPKSHGYPAYDFRSTPDKYARSSLFGTITQTKKSETRNWQANKSGDPYKNDSRRPKLITEDYGNYIKIRGNVDGQTVYEISSHHKENTLVVKEGDQVKPNDVLAEIGNTGNSTGTHEHKEFRDANNKAIEVELVEEVDLPVSEMEKIPKDQIVRDLYKGLTDEWPTDDELKARLQENKNIVDLTKSLTGDTRFFNLYVKPFVPNQDVDKDKLLESYKETILGIKEILRRVGLEGGSDSEQMLSKMEWVVSEYLRLKEEGKPKVVYKYQDKDFSPILTLSNLVIILENKTS